MNEKCNDTSISKILNFILELQKSASNNPFSEEGCDRKRLGPDPNTSFNTRPITLYSCCNGELWTMPYTLNGETGDSTVFKITKVDCSCATFEILAPDPDTTDPLIPYVSTNNFFTIKLSCVLAIRCLADTFTN